ncbi:MAG: TIGR01440 family protein [Halarsenatibacteraceae bacterium]
MEKDLDKIASDLKTALDDLLAEANLKKGDIVIIGCSTSEIKGDAIGTASSTEVAEKLYPVIREKLDHAGLFAAFQGCEHINRAVTIEQECQDRYGFEEVTVVPHKSAGGAMSTTAFRHMNNPVVVEEITADAGIDIGDTLIGMHLKRVAVPVRMSVDQLGAAHLTAARTRPKLIGGPRAHYPEK